MCITKEVLQKMFDEAKDEIKDFVRKEDSKWYHKASDLIHTTSPETQQRVDDLHDHLRAIRLDLKAHVDKEETYWTKIETIDVSLNTLSDAFITHTEEMKKHTESIQVLSDVFASGRVLKGIATFIGWTLVIIGGAVSLKNWIIK